ncbi:MAG: hypothetical protein SXQ77_09395 [Halobacteria archaeon]|nr:hypothetical protein [Halobacteria archaeon]
MVRNTDWLSLENQAVVVLGVAVLFALWWSELVTPFLLGLPSYAVYLPLSGALQAVGLIGIEGSTTVFWISAFVWLYVFCSCVLWVTGKALGLRETATPT